MSDKKEITDEELYELIETSKYNRAKEKALYLIEYRSRTKRELYDNIRCEDRVIYDVTVVRELALSVDKIAYSNQYKYYYIHMLS